MDSRAVDMKKRFVLSALFGLAFLGLAVSAYAETPAHAETLDDASLRAFYASYTEAMKNDNNYQTFLQQRLDDKFSLQEYRTRIRGANPREYSSDTYDKGQQILGAIRETNDTHITNVKNDILGIAFSKDHKHAFVTYTMVTLGTTKITDVNGSYVDGTYEDAEGCADELMLKKDLIQIVKSACNGKIVARQL
jgi:hypothetical protein